MEKTGNFISSMPSWAKGVIGVGVMLGIGLLSYKIYTGIKARNEQKGSRQEESNVSNELKKLSGSDKTKPTLTPAQLSIFANSLSTAMDGYGHNVTDIYRVFANMKNDADVLALIKAYGTRTLSSGRFNPEPNYTGALGGAITLKLSTEEIDALNMMLAKSAIKYRF